jgi:ABC-2 type transport system ATP-binding protein
MSSENGLLLRGITKRYPGFTLKPLSKCVPRGHIVALVGKNGAGKTTLLKTAFGLVTPDAGEVALNGCVIVDGQDRSATKAKFAIGYLPEEQIFYEWMSVTRLLGFCGAMHPGWQPAKAASLLRHFELDERKKVGELSKGMRVKLGLLIALSHGPQALLLDEPLSGLDPLSRKTMMDQLRLLVRELDCSCLVSSHDLEDVKKVSDAIWVLREGELSLEVTRGGTDNWESDGAILDSLYDSVCDAM